MPITADRHGGAEFLQQACFEDSGIGDPPSAAQLLYSAGDFKAYDSAGVFNLRRPWDAILEEASSDQAGVTLYKTVSYGGALPQLVSYFSDAAKTKRIATKAYVYGGPVAVLPSQILYRLYAADGFTVRLTCTDTLTYAGGGVLETARTRAFS